MVNFDIYDWNAILPFTVLRNPRNTSIFGLGVAAMFSITQKIVSY